MSRETKPKESHVERSIALDSSRKNAVKSLSKVHKMESDRLASGYRWVTNDVDTKLVSPKRLNILLYKGYRVIEANHLNS